MLTISKMLNFQKNQIFVLFLRFSYINFMWLITNRELIVKQKKYFKKYEIDRMLIKSKQKDRKKHLFIK